MRLTRRGRVVVVVAALLVAFAIGVFVTAAGSVATQQPGTPEPTKIVQVGTGDTLWDIAADLADDGDVRAMMEQIKQLNALDSGDLQAGQRLGRRPCRLSAPAAEPAQTSSADSTPAGGPGKTGAGRVLRPDLLRPCGPFRAAPRAR